MDFDIVIVGGGLAGLALAAALRRSSLSVALVESKAPVFPEGWDSRIYAISPPTPTSLRKWGHGTTWKRREWKPCDPWRSAATQADGWISPPMAAECLSWHGYSNRR